MITFDKPTVRHNGGMLLFGPDGYLWMSLGEGGKASVNSQDPFRLLSSILRLDVDSGEPYGTPPDNPYVDGTGAPEVWAKGLRNPWRFTIDEDLIYIADVGHSDYEEINVVPLNGAPYNFGWLRMEGTHCFQSGCDPVAENLTLPVHEYTHAEGCSVTGGVVYRGTPDSRAHRSLSLCRLVWGVGPFFPFRPGRATRTSDPVRRGGTGEQLRRRLSWRGLSPHLRGRGQKDRRSQVAASPRASGLCWGRP